MLGFLKTKRVPIEKIETVIGSNTSFSGHLKCDGNVRIDGVCESGTIETVGNVLVTESGDVAAKIIAENVSVAGHVSGEIIAHGRLEIIGQGYVSGAVQVANFYKDETARLEGTLAMGDEVSTPAETPVPEAEPETVKAGSSASEETEAAADT